MSKGEGLAIISSEASASAPSQGAHGADSADGAYGPLSRQALRVRRRYEALWSLLSPQELHHLAQPDSQALVFWGQILQAVTQAYPDPKAALRVMRQLLVAKLSLQDQADVQSLSVTTAAMTSFAEFALGVALREILTDLSRVHGQPMDAAGSAQSLWIVGMGKLGGRELNVSSDIDLVYLYPEDGETGGTHQGAGSISKHEFFAKSARALQAWIADVTEHGFVFRIDLALRPHGQSGPVVCSLAALREYLLGQGREWERLAWMKSRVITPTLSASQARPLRDLVTPFVYRRYLDYPVFDALRELHRQIRDHASKRAVGRPSRAEDVKLGRGGIREIEFLVQSQQIVRGGQFPELRTRSTLKGLERLARAKELSPSLAAQLARDYCFLRNLEHAIQYLDDAQTHELPSNDEDLVWVAKRMGFDTSCGLLCALAETRERVATAFDGLLGPIPVSGKCKGCNCDDASASSAAPPDTWLAGISALGVQYPDVAKRLSSLAEHPHRRALKPSDDMRLRQVLERAVAYLRAGACTQLACVCFVDWVEGLLRREGYLALMVERPLVVGRVLRLMGSSRWAVRYLTQHPGLVDELASEHWLSDRFDAPAFVADLQARRAALALGGEDDEEALMNLLRRAQHAQVFRTLARDLEGLVGVEAVADDLSDLADAMIELSLCWIWQSWWSTGDRRAHQAQAQLLVLAYGKLGGKELGYGSDLDLVFIHDDPHERAQECYAALAKKLINWFTTKTALGDLYEIDTALRPNGNAGLLVTQLAAFEQYQRGRGSNAAWTWEHQAITRARVVCGPKPLCARVEAVRAAVLQSPRDAQALCAEVVAMRERMRRAHPGRSDRFDLKHSPGGMIDVEFAVQTLVLLHAGRAPSLLENLGNMGLLRVVDAHGLLPGTDCLSVAEAYRKYRAAQHARRLNEQDLAVLAVDWQPERDAVSGLCAAVGLGSMARA